MLLGENKRANMTKFPICHLLLFRCLIGNLVVFVGFARAYFGFLDLLLVLYDLNILTLVTSCESFVF